MIRSCSAKCGGEAPVTTDLIKCTEPHDSALAGTPQFSKTPSGHKNAHTKVPESLLEKICYISELCLSKNSM